MIPEKQNEAVIPLNADGTAELKTWRIVVNGYSTAPTGPIVVSTQLARLSVAAPFVAHLLGVPEKHESVGPYSSLIQAAFLVGWALGGALGLRTVGFALAAGPLIAGSLRLLGRTDRGPHLGGVSVGPPAPDPSVATDGEPG